MKAQSLKSEKRVDTPNWRSLKIQAWGSDNRYLEKARQIRACSPTGSGCNELYAKFIYGSGFVSKELAKLKIGKQTVRDLALSCANDTTDGGFALHINYNMLFEVISINHVPLEHVRFAELSENGTFEKYGVHRNFSGMVDNIKTPKTDKEIDWIHKYNPLPDVILAQVVDSGGWDNYNGQLLYISNTANGYPLPKYDSVLTDMSTEEGISNISYRNARNNFLGAGVFIDRTTPGTETKDQDDNVADEFIAWQTDKNACKMLYIQLKPEDPAPELIKMDFANYDKAYEVTEKTAKQRIGARYMQPPILRSENTGASWGADLMINAYDFYNSVTATERDTLSEVILDVLRRFFPTLPIAEDEGLRPLAYIITKQTTETTEP